MPEDKIPENYRNKSVVDILNGINDGSIKGDEVPPDIRQECVEHLWMVEGYSTVAIAKALRVSERTIKRDKNEIRIRNAQKPSADHALEVIGELLQKATSAQEHLTRLAHSTTGKLQEKAQAGFYVWKVIQEQAKLLQSLGYAPEKSIQIDADIHHHEEKEEETPAELKEKLSKLEKLAEEKGNIDPEISNLIQDAKKKIALAEANEIINKLEEKLGESEKEKGTP